VQGGGTAGVTPSELNTAAVSWIAAAGDRLKLVIDNTTAGTPTVDGVIIANPA
jgi:Na+/H+ antiporter NhaC